MKLKLLLISILILGSLLFLSVNHIVFTVSPDFTYTESQIVPIYTNKETTDDIKAQFQIFVEHYADAYSNIDKDFITEWAVDITVRDPDYNVLYSSTRHIINKKVYVYDRHEQAIMPDEAVAQFSIDTGEDYNRTGTYYLYVVVNARKPVWEKLFTKHYEVTVTEKAPEPPRYDFWVSTRDVDTHEAIGGVKVEFFRDGDLLASRYTSSSDGSAPFSNLLAGNITLKLSKDGYYSREFNGVLDGNKTFFVDIKQLPGSGGSNPSPSDGVNPINALPGFELLSLLGAIGVAFIVLRRK